VEGNLSNLVAKSGRRSGRPAQSPLRPPAPTPGYAFCNPSAAEGSADAAARDCWLVFGGGRVPSTQRAPDRAQRQVRVPIDDMTISRHHARILVDDQVTLVDLGSRNRTYVTASA
jgi:hypothetical protein